MKRHESSGVSVRTRISMSPTGTNIRDNFIYTVRIVSTEIGKVARQATEQSEEETPLSIQLTKLAGFIGKIGFTIATLTFIVFTAKDLSLIHI